MPPPFSDMLRAAAAEFEGSIAASTAGQILQTLRDQVTPVCQQTVTNRYPFVRSSGQEVPLADFAKLFSPNGVMDKFFTQPWHLMPIRRGRTGLGARRVPLVGRSRPTRSNISRMRLISGMRSSRRAAVCPPFLAIRPSWGTGARRDR